MFSVKKIFPKFCLSIHQASSLLFFLSQACSIPIYCQIFKLQLSEEEEEKEIYIFLTYSLRKPLGLSKIFYSNIVTHKN